MTVRRPMLVRHARYRWDELRGQHQLVFPEGLLVLNDTAAAVLQACDGRTVEELIADLEKKFPDGRPEDDVREFLDRLAKRGLLRDAAAC